MRAMRWGIGVVVIIATVTLWMRAPGTISGPQPIVAPVGRAFGALFLYTGLFWVTLLKVWWTAGRPAVTIGRETVSYQPLHTFSPRRIAYEDIVVCQPRTQTSLRIVHRDRRDRGRELFLNLAVIQGRHGFLDALGEKLEAAGVASVVGRKETWVRPGAESLVV